MGAEQEEIDQWTAVQRQTVERLPENPYFLADVEVFRRWLGLPLDGYRDSYSEAWEWLVRHQTGHVGRVERRYGVRLVGSPPDFERALWERVNMLAPAEQLTSSEEGDGESVWAVPSILLGLPKERAIEEMKGLRWRAKMSPLWFGTIGLCLRYGLPYFMWFRMFMFVVQGSPTALSPGALLVSESTDAEELTLNVQLFSAATTKQDWENAWPRVREILERKGWRPPGTRRRSKSKVERDATLLQIRQDHGLTWPEAFQLFERYIIQMGKDTYLEQLGDEDAAIRGAQRLATADLPKVKGRQSFEHMLADFEPMLRQLDGPPICP